MESNNLLFCHLWLLVLIFLEFGLVAGKQNIDKKARKEEVLEMFSHAYNSYMTYAYPADELMPLSCRGRVRGREPSRGDVDDSLGNFSLTLIDSLDTLAVLGLIDEFEDAVRKIINDVTFDTDVVVSVFETNIRVLGGLLGGHVVATDLQNQYGYMPWYKDELLQMAKDIGYRLLPSFNTTTGVPYPRVNLKHGLGKGRHERDTCTACAGTMLLEFSALSRLSGDPIFEEKAHSVMQTLWSKRQRTSNLMGTVLNIHTGDWVRRESGVGAGIDSYYEYLLKGYILLGDEAYLDRFNTHYEAVMRYISDGPMLLDVQMHRPHAKSKNFMDALLAFWPGLQVLFGDIEPAIETHEMLYQVTQRHNFLPEAFTPQYDVYWAQHPLRPEFIESTYMLYEATSDPYYLEVGEKIIDALQDHARVHCGFAGIKDVRTGSHEDRMDSFVLAETFKYLYLLFAEPEDLVLNVNNYLFTTEAHLLPLTLAKTGSTNSQNVTDTANKEEIVTSVVVERSCPNHKYLFPSGSSYAQALRDPLKKAREGQGSQCPSTQQPKTPVSDAARLKASEFVPGNQDHMQQLTKMGIRLITMKDGRVQLMHTASNAVTPQAAEEGALFMQEMIELSKNQQAEVAEHHPRVVQVMSPETLKNMVLAAGPAQFGLDLNENFAAVGELIVAEPLTACSDLTNGHEMGGRIVLMSRGDCMFIEKARNIEKFGAHGGVVIDNVAETSSDTAAMFAMSGDGTNDVNIPMVFLFSKEGKILMDAVEDHQVVEVLLLDKAKTAGEINEIWGHYHSMLDEANGNPVKIKADVVGAQITNYEGEEEGGEDTSDHDADVAGYDEDGDDEFECPAIIDIIDHHQGGQTFGDSKAGKGMLYQSGDGVEQLMSYLQQIGQFMVTKEDIEKLLGQSQTLGAGEEFRESAQAKLDRLVEQYQEVNSELKERLGKVGSSTFLSSSTPDQLQSVFDNIMKQYLETPEGKQYRADKAESALKHSMDSYDNFQIGVESISLDNIPKDVLENIFKEYMKMETVRLGFDKLNPLHKMTSNADSDTVTNVQDSRTKPLQSADESISELRNLPPNESDVNSDTQTDNIQSEDSAHIQNEPQQGGSDAEDQNSGEGDNMDPQWRLRREVMLQRRQQLQEQYEANLERQRNQGESIQDSHDKDEL